MAVLGDEASPYLPTLLPALLAWATKPTDVEVGEGTEAEWNETRRNQTVCEANGLESMTVAIPGRGWTKVALNTTEIQEKGQAIRAIGTVVTSVSLESQFLRDLLDPFVQQLVPFPYSSDVRALAAQTLAAIFDALCELDDKGLVAAYLPKVSRVIAEQIRDEGTGDIENLYLMVDALSDTYYSVYSRPERDAILAHFSAKDGDEIVELCMNALKECVQRRSEISAALAGSDLGSEDERFEYEVMLEAEDKLLTPLVDSIGYTLKFFRQAFMRTFESLVVPALGQYLQNGNDIRARVSAVCLFDDCVEHCGPEAAAKYAPLLAPACMLGLDDATNGGDEDLKRASAYGIAQIARYGPHDTLLPYGQLLLERLGALASSPEEQEERPAVYENAISALASLVLFGPSPFRTIPQREAILHLFLEALPLREDPDEAQICHAGLCEMLEKGSLVPDARIVRIVGDLLACIQEGEDLASNDVCFRLTGVLYQAQHPQPLDGLLSPQAQSALSQALQEYSRYVSNVVTP